MSDKKKIFLAIIFLLALIIFFSLMSSFFSDKTVNVTAPVKRGDFEVNVTVSGELMAKNSEDILGPGLLRSVGIWQIKISDLIPEGTQVKKGDFVASLDKTEIVSKLKELENDLLKSESRFLQTQLDTTLDLRNVRDDLQNQEYLVKEKKIAVEQSIYEPPSTQRQVQIEMEKAERTLLQSKENYKIKINQAKAKMQEVNASLSQVQLKYNKMDELFSQLNITAPKDGMVIYQKEWDGKKRKVGSTIGPWSPAVATLPDLSVMISKTYINEIDINKIKPDQKVRITLDAMPEKNLTGKIISVANVGEQRPGSESKVFEVDILINESDTSLRPSMTTGNTIITSSFNQVLFIPLEAIYKENGKYFVFEEEKFSSIKREVKVSGSNENDIIIHSGLNEGDVVLLNFSTDSSATAK